MSMSPAGLLAKLDELKKWQQTQQDRLLKQHQSRLDATNNSSSCNTIQGLSAFGSINYSPENPVVVKEISPKDESKPKQPFLRRGAGLQKFGMQTGDQMRPFNKMKPQKTAVHKRLAQLRKAEKSNQIQSAESDSSNKVQSDMYDLIELKKNDKLEKCDKIQLENHEKYNRMQLKNNNKFDKFNNGNKVQIEKQVINSNSLFNDQKYESIDLQQFNQIDSHKNIENIDEVGNYNHTDQLDESIADYNQYHSMDNQLEGNYGYTQFQDKNPYELNDNNEHDNKTLPTQTILTPLKMPEINILPKAQWVNNEVPTENSNTHIINQINEIASGKLKTNPQPPINNSNIMNNDILQYVEKLAAEKFGQQNNHTADESDLMQQIHALISNNTIQTPDAHKNLLVYLQDMVRANATTDSLNSTEYERAIEKELQVFEQLEQKVMHSSFCSTNSSVLDLLSSTPLKFIKQNVEKKTVHFDEGSARVKSSVKKVLDFQGSDGESSVDSTDFEGKTVLEENNNSECTDTLSSETTSCSSVISLPNTKVVVKQNACVMTDDFDFTILSQNSDEEMKKKLKELDREISNFRTENAKLHKSKNDIEKARRELDKSRKKMEKELQEERIKIEYELGEEKKKLAKEKMVFEKYVKDLQNKPSKKEREEVSLLKTELANVKETLKLKETRNGTTQARLRNQLKSTERENANLKEEIERLQKQNAKLTATQKVANRKPSDTKMLHEINKNLTKLAQDAKVSKQCDKAEKSVDKLNDSLIMLEDSYKHRKSGGKYKTEYQRSYSQNCNDSDDDDESDNTHIKTGHTYFDSDNEDSVTKANWQKVASNTKSCDYNQSRLKEIGRNRKSCNKDEIVSNKFDSNRSNNKRDTRDSDGSSCKFDDYSVDDLNQTNKRNRNRSSNNKNESDDISWSKWSRNDDDISMDETNNKGRTRTNHKNVRTKNDDCSIRDRLQQKYDTDENISDRSCKSRLGDDDEASYQDKTILNDKENDRNSTNFDFTTFRNLSLEDSYDRVFGSKEAKMRNNSLNDTQASAVGKIETILQDGSKETKYPNGNIKLTSADGNIIKLNYFNGDIKETKLLEGVIKYFYLESEMWQTTLPSGDEVMEFSDGQVEKRFANGATEVQFPNGLVKHTDKDGTETIKYPDGSVVTTKNDEKILLLPNGQKEYHTKDQKRREYPDGTIKILYPDGLQETRYSNGRIRMKDRDGHLLMDTHSDDL